MSGEIDVWVTKYALSKGVYSTKGAVSSSAPNMVQITTGELKGHYFHGEGRDWHRSAVAARARVLVLVKSCKKAIECKEEKLDIIEAEVLAGQLSLVIEKV